MSGSRNKQEPDTQQIIITWVFSRSDHLKSFGSPYRLPVTYKFMLFISIPFSKKKQPF